MGHGTKVINFVRLDCADNVKQVGGIGKITIMQEKAYTRLQFFKERLFLFMQVRGRGWVKETLDSKKKALQVMIRLCRAVKALQFHSPRGDRGKYDQYVQC